MSLTTGGAGMPANWGSGASLFNYTTGRLESGGFVWMGREPCTAADKQALKERFGPAVQIDSRSLVGMNSPKYSHFFAFNNGKPPYVQHLVVRGKKK